MYRHRLIIVDISQQARDCALLTVCAPVGGDALTAAGCDSRIVPRNSYSTKGDDVQGTHSAAALSGGQARVMKKHTQLAVTVAIADFAFLFTSVGLAYVMRLNLGVNLATCAARMIPSLQRLSVYCPSLVRILAACWMIECEAGAQAKGTRTSAIHAGVLARVCSTFLHDCFLAQHILDHCSRPLISGHAADGMCSASGGPGLEQPQQSKYLCTFFDQ